MKFNASAPTSWCRSCGIKLVPGQLELPVELNWLELVVDLGDGDMFVGDCITVDTNESSRMEKLNSLLLDCITEALDSLSDHTL